MPKWKQLEFKVADLVYYKGSKTYGEPPFYFVVLNKKIDVDNKLYYKAFSLQTKNYFYIYFGTTSKYYKVLS